MSEFSSSTPYFLRRYDLFALIFVLPFRSYHPARFLNLSSQSTRVCPGHQASWLELDRFVRFLFFFFFSQTSKFSISLSPSTCFVYWLLSSLPFLTSAFAMKAPLWFRLVVHVSDYPSCSDGAGQLLVHSKIFLLYGSFRRISGGSLCIRFLPLSLGDSRGLCHRLLWMKFFPDFAQHLSKSSALFDLR